MVTQPGDKTTLRETSKSIFAAVFTWYTNESGYNVLGRLRLQQSTMQLVGDFLDELINPGYPFDEPAFKAANDRLGDQFYEYIVDPIIGVITNLVGKEVDDTIDEINKNDPFIQRFQ